jgi:phage shock protein PspC (stress-responsive transcriptional regulator)
MFDFGVYRSRTNKMFLGVCGGLAEYFDVSSKMVRLITIGLAVFLPGISIWGVLFAYLVLGLVLPVKDTPRTFH